MIGETKTDIEESERNRLVTAIRDALIGGGITLFSQLTTYGYPPTPEVIYTSLIAAGTTFVISLGIHFGIHKAE